MMSASAAARAGSAATSRLCKIGIATMEAKNFCRHARFPLKYNAFSSVSVPASDIDCPRPSDVLIPAVPPPNLKIDPRALSSPYFDASTLPAKKGRRRAVAADAVGGTSPTLAEQLADAPEVLIHPDAVAASGTVSEKNLEETDEEDDDEEDVSILEETDESLINISRAVRAMTYVAPPLPGRLIVPLVPSFFDPHPGDETFDLPERIFGLDDPRPDILHRCVIYYRNKKRGKRVHAITRTIATKRGSGAKMRPQKGTGAARAGHKRPPHWRGGAKAHGPKGGIQDYTTKLNAKVRKLGLRVALSQKLREGNLLIMDDVTAPTFRTRVLSTALRKMEFGVEHDGHTALIVGGQELDPNLAVACGNIHGIHYVKELTCSVYDILRHEKLVLGINAVQCLEKRL